MFTVLKGFTSETVSASKGKVIEIKDKSVADALLKAGVIAPYSKKEMSNKEKDTEIQNLNNQLSEKDTEIQNLKDQLSEKDTEIQTLNDIISEMEQNKVVPSENPDDTQLNDNENLDNNSSTPNEDEKTGEEPKDEISTENNDDKTLKNKE